MRIAYKLCTYSENCILTEAEAQGNSDTVEVITASIDEEIYGDLSVDDKKTRITYSG